MKALRRAVLLTGAILSTGAPARAQEQQEQNDAWFGHDKALHFAASASIAVVAYGGTALVTDDRPTRLAVGAGVALAAGVAKETWDLSGHGDASWRDLTWDVVGTTTGVLIAYAIDWAIGRLRSSSAAPAAADRVGH